MPNSNCPEHGWTIATYAAHNEALRRAEEKFNGERDRRYTEVKNAEREALRVKEEANKDALSLAREIQTYKDEKANELRSQIERERGSYATQQDLKAAIEKIEVTLVQLRDSDVARSAGGKGMKDMWGWIVAAVFGAASLFNTISPHVKP